MIPPRAMDRILSFGSKQAKKRVQRRARLRHPLRLAAEPDRLWDRDDLMRLEPSDVMDDEPG
jgi:hypothetical protein